jgi:hypothetical protein
MSFEVRCASCGYEYAIRSSVRAVCPRCWAAASPLQKLWRFIPLFVALIIAVICFYVASMQLTL